MLKIMSFSLLIILTCVFLVDSLPMFEHSDLEEDPSYPLSNIQEALNNLSAPLATWLEERQANFDSFKLISWQRRLAQRI